MPPASRHAENDPDAVGELAARLRLSTTRLARRLRSEADIGLSPSLLSALATVRVHGPLTLGELAERERVSKPAVTKIVGRLEARDLVVRIVDEDDRRICRVRITTAGEGLMAESRARKNAWLVARLAAAGDERRRDLARAMDLLEELAMEDAP